MSDSHTNFHARQFSAGAGALVFAGAAALAGAIVADRDRMQAQADDIATAGALASWQRLVQELEHDNVTLRTDVAERDHTILLLGAEVASLRQRLADAGAA